MYVASNHFVWRLVPVSIAIQIRQLLQDKQFELALQLAVRTPSLRNLFIPGTEITYLPREHDDETLKRSRLCSLLSDNLAI